MIIHVKRGLNFSLSIALNVRTLEGRLAHAAIPLDGDTKCAYMCIHGCHVIYNTMYLCEIFYRNSKILISTKVYVKHELHMHQFVFRNHNS